MRSGLIPLFSLLSILQATAGLLPLTTRDVSLMLRGGDSSAMVMGELAKRRFVDSLDLDKEQMLIKSGAKPELIAALRAGTYSLSASDGAKAKQQLDDLAKRRAAEAEQTRQSGLKQEPLNKGKSGAPNVADARATGDFLKGSLVHLHNGSVVPADEEAIEKKKLIAYYFSAHWCAPCRKFTPELVDYYNRVSAQHPEFEIVFYSCDRSAADMENYMRETNMPWPAIEYSKREGKNALLNAAGSGIPSLVLVESTGKLISASYDGSNYRGPKKVLEDLDAIFAGTSSASQIAQTNTH